MLSGTRNTSIKRANSGIDWPLPTSR